MGSGERAGKRTSFKSTAAHESMWATSEWSRRGACDIDGQTDRSKWAGARESISIKRGRLGIFGATLQNASTSPKRYVKCFLDLTHIRFPANLTLARVRRQKDHSRKLQNTHS